MFTSLRIEMTIGIEENDCPFFRNHSQSGSREIGCSMLFRRQTAYRLGQKSKNSYNNLS
jgi:hypothetical protein